MIEAIIILTVAVILFIFLRKLPQIKERKLQRNSSQGSFNWISFKRKIRATVRSSFQKIKDLFSGQKRSFKKKKVRKFRVNIPKSYRKARQLFQQGDLSRSEKTCLRLIALRPRESKLFYLLYQIYQAQANPKEATLALREAIKRREDGFWLMELAELYQQLEKYSRAEKVVKRAVKMNNTIAMRFAILAKIQLKLKKKAEALISIERALQMEPNNGGYKELKIKIEEL
jgi:tetratricopeptide (TPR) repeat protein